MGQYFVNSEVEALVIKYQATGCTDIALRNEVMSNADKLIKGVINTFNLHNVYTGKDNASYYDLYQVAWLQIEKTLYKFDPTEGHTKLFNMWTSIAHTVMLAEIKKDSKDRISYTKYLDHSLATFRDKSVQLEHFFSQAKEMFKFDDMAIALIDAIEKMYDTDPEPWNGIKTKLCKITGFKRPEVTKFLGEIRNLAFQFDDIMDRPYVPSPEPRDPIEFNEG